MNYVRLHVGRETHRMREKIGELAGRVDPGSATQVQPGGERAPYDAAL